jgi:hypothetical protein
VSIKRRLGELETRRETEASQGTTPPELGLFFKVIASHQAREEGKEPPPYTQEEIVKLRQDDLEIAAGRGVVVQLRKSVGWQSEEALATLKEWEEDARRRLGQAENLPPERWCEVWGVVEQ